jgi:Zn-dependent protease
MLGVSMPASVRLDMSPGTEAGRTYAETLAQLRSEPAAHRTEWLVPLSAVLFLLAAYQWSSPDQIAALVTVILLHEAGHLAAMKALGYRDTKIFFVPFLGAAAVGRREDAAAWQRAVVFLAGPLPGLAIGLVLLLGSWPLPPFFAHVASMLVWLNAFNLLPLEPLDGGRLLNVLVFSRHAAVESAFVVSTSLALGTIGAMAFRQHVVVLEVIAVIGLVVAPMRHFARAAAIEVKKRCGSVPQVLVFSDGPFTRELFREVYRLASRFGRPHPHFCARLMKTVHELAATRTASWRLSGALLGVYGLAVGAAAHAVVLTMGGRAMP